MELVSDLVLGLPTPVLLAIVGVAALGAPSVALLVGGQVAVAAILVGVGILLLAGAALALKVHVLRMPLRLSEGGVRLRIDGHPAWQFRAQLGLGRRMDVARATVRFVPEHGEPVALQPLMDHGERLVGPWTVVVVDREERVKGPGRFEVRVTATERGKAWEAETAYSDERMAEGRFVPTLRKRDAGWFRKQVPFDQITPGEGGATP